MKGEWGGGERRGEERGEGGEVEAGVVERVWGGYRAWGRGHGVFKYIENSGVHRRWRTSINPSSHIHPVHSRTQELKTPKKLRLGQIRARVK
jgi:hypothetical protein